MRLSGSRHFGSNPNPAASKIMQGALRTKESQKHYLKLMSEGFLNNGCNLCIAPAINEFKYWRIVDNKFPYDLIAKINHMILPKRHTNYKGLSREEKDELDVIRAEYIGKNYVYIVETVEEKKSIPAHFHLHLIVPKDYI